MDGACHQFLAGTAFAKNQHGMSAVRGLGNDAIQPVHFRRLPHHAPNPCFDFTCSRRRRFSVASLQMRGYPIQHQAEFVEVERLGDVVIRAPLSWPAPPTGLWQIRS